MLLFYVWFIFMNVNICVPYIYVFYFITGHHGGTMEEQCNWCAQWQMMSTPFAKSNGRFFQTQKLTWCLYPLCLILAGAKNECKCSFSAQDILTFCIKPFCIGVRNAVSVIFFKSSLHIIVNFLLTFYGFKWNFLNFKLDTLSLSHPNFMAIGLTVTKPSANKCRSLCKLISNSMHANLGQTNDRIARK